LRVLRREDERRFAGLDPIHEQADGTVLRLPFRIELLAWWRQLERRNGHCVFAVNAQNASAGDKDLQLSAACEQFGQRGATCQKVFEIV
jgi:hypothetical protein